MIEDRIRESGEARCRELFNQQLAVVEDPIMMIVCDAVYSLRQIYIYQ